MKLVIKGRRDTLEISYPGATMKEISVVEVEEEIGVKIEDVIRNVSIIDGDSGLRPTTQLVGIDKAYRIQWGNNTRIVLVFTDAYDNKIVVIWNPATRTTHGMYIVR